jgi:nucleoside-diphosphate-sugar epimerase
MQKIDVRDIVLDEVMSMARCFVTGGTGFIGSHIVRTLKQADHEVDVVIRESSSLSLIEDLNITPKIGDVTNQESLMAVISSDTDWLFHNAAIMADWGGKDHFFPINVEGTRNILEVVRKKDIPFLVHTSSTAIYGFPNSIEPLHEESPRNPVNAYQESKLESEELFSEYEQAYGLKISRVRPPTVFGQGDMYTGPQLIEFIKTGSMVVFGDGRNIQSYVHAEDVARCLLLAAENQAKSVGNAYNVTSFTTTFIEFVEALASELGVDKKIRHIPYRLAKGLGGLLSGLYKGFSRSNPPLLTSFRVKLLGSNYKIDDSKVREELGYQPKWDLDSTVKDMVQWGGEVKPR